MSLPREVARAPIPRPVRRSIRSSLSATYHAIRWPFRTPLYRDIMRCESRKTDATVRELKGFEELEESAWSGLETLAYQMVKRFRPKVIVELGTHMGLSALAMGLALRDLGEGGKLYAVDCWEGDPQAGFYGDEVYRTFLGRIEQLKLGSIILPLKMYFDEALNHVEKPIDLLHIDGLHTWEAVNHDFDTFGPLVRPGGLVIFHDVNSAWADLRRFWEGMEQTHDVHTIPYSNGLGILRTKRK